MLTNKEFYILTGIGVVLTGTMIGIHQYNHVKARQFKERVEEADRKLRQKKLENEELYFSKLTPEQVENLEKEKLEVKMHEIELKKAEAEAKKSETELKKTVTQFKQEIQSEIQRTTNSNIERDMRHTFDDWSAKYEDRLDKKLDRVVTRIDDLSDKYGGVKAGNGSSSPTISVVNAPNNQ